MTIGTEASEGFAIVGDAQAPEPKMALSQKKASGPKFMLFVEGESLPTRKHGTFNSAYREAVRLSELFPKQQIMVVKHYTTFKARDNPEIIEGAEPRIVREDV